MTGVHLMTTRALIFLLVASSGASAAAGPLESKEVPAGVRWYAHLDLDAARAAAVAPKVYERWLSRGDAHEWLRDLSIKAWNTLQASGENPLVHLMMDDENIRQYLSEEQIYERMNVTSHTGSAPDRALGLAEKIKQELTG